MVWFALNEYRPLTAFAGIWTEFNSYSSTKSRSRYRGRTMNAVVEPIHPKARSVTTDEERDVWMRAVGRGQGLAAAVAG